MTESKGFRKALLAAGLAVLLGGVSMAGLEGLEAPAQIVLDPFGVPTIVAQTEHDAIFLQGYMHAKDRFFQMDFQRRGFSGTVSELVGTPGLPSDVEARTLGLRRAAEVSLPAQTPEVMAWLEAYSDGVNAWLTDTSQPLPIEYASLELDRGGIPLWTPLDSLTTAKGLAFNLSSSFLDDIDRTLAILSFRGVGDVLGFNGLQLFNTDLYRTAPFDPTISIPSAAVPAPLMPQSATAPACFETRGPVRPDLRCQSADSPVGEVNNSYPPYMTDPNFKTLLQNYRDKVTAVPWLREILETDYTKKGSNWWVASGAVTDSGYPMIANDPHLALGTPATFYEVHLNVAGGINITGVSFPGAPGLVLGCNDTICWGATVNGLDVVDVYQEVLLPLGPDPTQPTHTYFEGVPEPLSFIPQTFLFNNIGDGVPNTLFDAGVPPESGGVTLIVPRRNNGPIVQIQYDPASPTPFIGISVMHTLFSPTQELEAFRQMAHATTPDEFKDALQFFDVGSQNWSYADINGNIAYFTSAELPIREDLQTLFFPAGLQPPFLIRDGTHTLQHEWLPVMNPQPHQAVGWEILPFNEMPQIVNPPEGYILNANNDPIGTSLNNVPWDSFRAGFNGLLYLSPGYATGFRIGRIKRLWDEALASGPVTLADFIAIQGNNQLLDAEVLTPYLLDAFANATAPGAHPDLAALGADPRVDEAISRLGAWDFSTPTGIIEGFDPGDNPAAPVPPSAAEIDASVAATIYSVWRGQFVQRVIDGTLNSLPVPLGSFAPGSSLAMSAVRKFLEDYPVKGGISASLINFFNVPGVADQDVARDLILLGSLASALDLLASDEMAPAFGNSTDLSDYRWGKLHRITFAHPLGGPLDVPPTPVGPGNLSPELTGFARAGGMGAVDASSHSARADGLNEFKFGSGPSRRFIATLTPSGPSALEVIPGGESGDPYSPHRTDELPLWLVNAYKPLPVSLEEVLALAVEVVDLAPPECGDGEIDAGEECDDGINDGTACNPDCTEPPLLVELESFTATLTSSGVRVDWTTAVEIETIGFRVLRSNGLREKGLELLTQQAIPAQGSDLVGASYSFVDTHPLKGAAFYYLDELDRFGRTTRHGPVAVERGRVSRSGK